MLRIGLVHPPFPFQSPRAQSGKQRSVTLDGCLTLGTWQDGIAPEAAERRDQKPGRRERVPQRLLLPGPGLLSAAAASTQPASLKTERDGEGRIGKG